MEEIMSVTFPLESGLLTTVRLTTGGVCSLAGLDLDDSEDCKLCVTESLLVLLRNGFSRARLAFSLQGGLSVQICGESAGAPSAKEGQDELSLALLGALVKDLVMEREGDVVCKIAFRFGA